MRRGPSFIQIRAVKGTASQATASCAPRNSLAGGAAVTAHGSDSRDGSEGRGVSESGWIAPGHRARGNAVPVWLARPRGRWVPAPLGGPAPTRCSSDSDSVASDQTDAHTGWPVTVPSRPLTGPDTRRCAGRCRTSPAGGPGHPSGAAVGAGARPTGSTSS